MRRLAVGLFFLLLPLLSNASGVILENLADFDPSQHFIGVNLHARASGGCQPDTASLEMSIESFLAANEFKVGPLGESHLEFAVSVAGFVISDKSICGIRLLSMVRQIPNIKILRLPPDSDSTNFRLWQTENVITGFKADLQSLLEVQALRDVTQFRQFFQQQTRSN